MALRSLNKVTLLGNLGKDPESGTTKNGNSWCRFSIATTESWKDKNTGEWKDATEWHNVSTFNDRVCKLATQYLRKGSKVLVEGQMKTRKFTDNNGVDRWNTEVEIPMFGGELVLLDKKDEPSTQKQTQNNSSSDIGDEIPW